MDEMRCSKCQKRLTHKRARLIDGKVICPSCLFPSLTKGRETSASSPA